MNSSCNGFEYLGCEKAGHFSQPLSLACMHPGCQAKQLLCHYCSKAHVSHSNRVCPLTWLLQHTGTNRFEREIGSHCLQIEEKLKSIRTNMLKKLQDLKKELQTQIQGFQELFRGFNQNCVGDMQSEVKILKVPLSYNAKAKKEDTLKNIKEFLAARFKVENLEENIVNTLTTVKLNLATLQTSQGNKIDQIGGLLKEGLAEVRNYFKGNLKAKLNRVQSVRELQIAAPVEAPPIERLTPRARGLSMRTTIQ